MRLKIRRLDSTVSLPAYGTNESAVTAQDATTLNTANNNNLGFFVKTTYIGAVKDSTDTWWQGWSCGLDATAC